jgi:hypothetical protein
MGNYVGDRCSRCGKRKSKGLIFYIIRLTLTCDVEEELEELSEEELARGMKEQLAKAGRMSEKELMDEVYQEFYFCLCKSCRDWLQKQLGSIMPQGVNNG